MDDRTPRLNRLFDRAAPALRNLDAAIAGNDDLREARDLIADRMASVARQAADAIKGVGAPEIVDVEVHAEQGPGGAVATPAAPATAGPEEPRAPHFNRARLGRMVAAAGREAVRPQSPTRATRNAALGAASLVGLLLVWRLLHRR